MSIPVASRTQTQSSSELAAKTEDDGSSATCRSSNHLKPPDGGWRAWSVVGGAWRNASARLWTDDALHLQNIPADITIARRMQRNWGFCHLAAVAHAALSVIPGWFNRRRGTAFGILATGSSVGGVVFSLVVGRLSARLSFGWAIRVCALLILFLMAIAFCTIKTTQPPSPRPFSLKHFCTPLTETRFLNLAVGLFLFTFGFYIPLNYIAAEATFGGAPAHWATYLVPILNATRIGSGLISDKVGKYNVFIIVCYLTSIFSLGLWTATKTAGTRIAFATLFGLFSGAYVTLLPALVHQISPQPEIGLRLGLVYLGCSVGGLTTNPIAGTLLESRVGWQGAKIFGGLMCFFGTSFVLAARWSQSRSLTAVI
ncbi:hypothetical protein PWT90_04699 [Aphanocladium album]|nr:hypothetical protein PWT90_04699 [Aphanocladium album]